MKKRFIILLDNAKNAQDEAFLAFVKAQGFGHWRWLSNSWLVTTQRTEIGVNFFCDNLQKIYPGIYFLVVEMRNDGIDNWIGFGPMAENKNMFTWLHQNWKQL